jgi:hypothetical protein
MKYMEAVQLEEEEGVAVVVSVESVDIVDDADEDPDDHGEDEEEVFVFEEHFDKLGLWVPGVYCKDTVLDETLAPHVQQRIFVCNNETTAGSDFRQGTPPPLPSTQNLLAALQQSSYESDVLQDVGEDTQMTTLSM